MKICKISIEILIILVLVLSTGAQKLVCYYASFHSSDVYPFHLCKTIVFYHFEMEPGTYELSAKGHDDDFVKRFVQNAKKMGSRVMMGLGSYGINLKEFSQLSEPDNQIKFNSVIKRALIQFKFSGLVIDWGYPSPRDKSTYIKVLRGLRPGLDGFDRFNRFKLAITAPCYERAINNGYDVPSMKDLVDEVHLHCHHLPEFFEGTSNTNSPLHAKGNQSSTDRGVAIWNNLGFPKIKLFIAVYIQGVLSNPDIREIPYIKICSKLFSGSLEEEWDQLGQVPYVNDGNNLISYENTRSLKVKADYVEKEHLGGIAFKFVNYDDSRGFCGPKFGLVKAVRREFQK